MDGIEREEKVWCVLELVSVHALSSRHALGRTLTNNKTVEGVKNLGWEVALRLRSVGLGNQPGSYFLQEPYRLRRR